VLLDPEARQALIELLLGRATVLTPNVPEAQALVARDGEPAPDANPDRAANPAGTGDVAALARAIHALGPRAVVVTGGHRDSATDVFFDGTDITEIPGKRHLDAAAHGSGCTHSSVLAARLAWGDEPLQAARVAKELAARAVANGLSEIGAGAGPVDVLGLGRRG
jgi:hydroxymethylpyrimidine/phosphomethylpyrimidine kinase